AAANTFRVNGASGSDIPACGDAAHPCKTIQFAVNKAGAGDTIIVAAGQYNETVTINKTLTVLGAQASKDARNRNQPLSKESRMIAASGAFDLQANGIVIDGFYLTGQTQPPAVLGTAIRTSPSFSGYHITNT